MENVVGLEVRGKDEALGFNRERAETVAKLIERGVGSGGCTTVGVDRSLRNRAPWVFAARFLQALIQHPAISLISEAQRRLPVHQRLLVLYPAFQCSYQGIGLGCGHYSLPLWGSIQKRPGGVLPGQLSGVGRRC